LVSDFTRWLRLFLGDERVSARSLKPTVLAWAARHGGVLRGARRTLGYHTKPKDRTVSIYSRDELAVPLRSLEVVYADIRSGRFDPDTSRSGSWASPSVSAPLPAQASSSASSSSSIDSEDGMPHDVLEDMGVDAYVLNTRSGLVHLDGGDDKLACGKPFTRHLRIYKEWPTDADAKCARCFK
jgi:hypothetical protein